MYLYQVISLHIHHHKLLSHTSPLHSQTFLDGKVYNPTQTNKYMNESVNEGDEWCMEVDLRSREKEKRTLHWFVRGKQQKGFITGVPDRVQFGV